MDRQLLVMLTDKKKLAPNIYSFFFNKPIDFNFIPGQYIRMILYHKNPDKEGSSRFFTIASNPLSENIMITTKFRDSSFKKALLRLNRDEKIEIFGPIGQFFLDERSRKSVVFLSGGMGITPFHSMISYIHEMNLHINTTLIASFNSINDVIFYKELDNIGKNNKCIKVIYTITSGGKNNMQWEGERGRIDENLIKKYVLNYLESTFYVTGPNNMVDSISKLLKAMNVLDENIIMEKFTGY